MADFIGSPAMNTLRLEGAAQSGATDVSLGGARIALPQLQEGASTQSLVLGLRPEHITLGVTGDLRGQVLATEYLGTTQIITIETAFGPLKARAPSGQPAHVGETLGLSFTAPKLTLFDAATGRALRSAANARGFECARADRPTGQNCGGYSQLPDSHRSQTLKSTIRR